MSKAFMEESLPLLSKRFSGPSDLYDYPVNKKQISSKGLTPIEKNILSIKLSETSQVKKMKYPNGEYYIGEMDLDRKRCGYGEYYFSNKKLMYQGKFENSQRSGFGILYDKDGAKRYEGHWKNNKGHGYGTVFDKDGCFTYKGNFCDGKMSGTGKSFSKIVCKNCQSKVEHVSHIRNIGDFKENDFEHNGRSYSINGKKVVEETNDDKEKVEKKKLMIIFTNDGSILKIMQ